MSSARLLVVDASVVVAALDAERTSGEWAARILAGARLLAPRVMPFEAANALRRLQLLGVRDATGVTLAHRQLLTLPVSLWPHRPLGERAWALRDNITYFDACYVALAELIDAPLVTLDRRLAQVPGPRCAFLTPPAQ